MKVNVVETFSDVSSVVALVLYTIKALILHKEAPLL